MQALQHKLDRTDFHSLLYPIAFIEGDSAGMNSQLDWAGGILDEYLPSSGRAAPRRSWGDGARRRNWGGEPMSCPDAGRQKKRPRAFAALPTAAQTVESSMPQLEKAVDGFH
jgi:hypothetical protein